MALAQKYENAHNLYERFSILGQMGKALCKSSALPKKLISETSTVLAYKKYILGVESDVHDKKN